MFPDCLAEGFVIGHASLIQGFQVDRGEALTLLVGDLQVTVNVDEVLETDVAGEAVCAAEGFGGMRTRGYGRLECSPSSWRAVCRIR
jgi:hypothetical protein